MMLGPLTPPYMARTLGLSGRAMQRDSAALRQHFAALVAHEMAHLWQSNVGAPVPAC